MENMRNLNSASLVNYTQGSKKDEKLININGLIQNSYREKRNKGVEAKNTGDLSKTPVSHSRIDKSNNR